MKVELKNKIRLPYSYDYLDKGTKLLLEVVKGVYYVCRTDNDNVICVHKDDCEVIEK